MPPRDQRGAQAALSESTEEQSRDQRAAQQVSSGKPSKRVESPRDQRATLQVLSDLRGMSLVYQGMSGVADIRGATPIVPETVGSQLGARMPTQEQLRTWLHRPRSPVSDQELQDSRLQN